VAIPLTSESAPVALIDSDQMPIVDLRESDPEPVASELVALVREAEDSEVEGGLVVAGRGRRGKRAEYRCAGCGYGIIVYGQPPSCPMCREPRWEHVEWRPFSQLLDFPLAPAASDVTPARAVRSATGRRIVLHPPAAHARGGFDGGRSVGKRGRHRGAHHYEEARLGHPGSRADGRAYLRW
jgi:hypothetical protein